MNREKANKILDRYKEGYSYTEACVLECLNLTGDTATYAGMRSEGMDEEIQDEDWRGRSRLRAILVGRSQR